MKYRLLNTLLCLLSHLPLWLLYILSDCMYFIVAKVLRYRQKVMRTNLHVAFPNKSTEECRRIEKACYHHICDIIVETVHLRAMSDTELDRRIKVINADLVDQYYAQNTPVILYLGHYGNWEWVPNIARHYSPDMRNGQIYRPLHDKAINSLMLDIRGRFNSTNIPQNSTVRTLLKWKNEGKPFLVGFIADQRSNSHNLNHWLTFMGQETAYPVGGEDIGQRINAAYLYLDIEKTQRGHYTLTFHEIKPLNDGKPYPFTRAFYKMFELTLRRQPELWLWTHRRWLYDSHFNRMYDNKIMTKDSH